MSFIVAIKETFKSKKILAAAIMFSITMFLSVLNIVISGTSFAFIEKLFPNAGSIMEAIELIGEVLTGFSIAGLVPIVLMTVAFWMLYYGGRKGVYKIVHISLLLLQCFFILKASILVFLLITAVVLMIICFELSMAWVGIVLFVVVLGYCAVLFHYYTDVVVMLFRVRYSLNTGDNIVAIKKSFIFISWVIAIFKFLSVLGGIVGFFSNVTQSITLIMMVGLFNDYSKRYPITDEQVRQMAEKRRAAGQQKSFKEWLLDFTIVDGDHANSYDNIAVNSAPEAQAKAFAVQTLQQEIVQKDVLPKLPEKAFPCDSPTDGLRELSNNVLVLFTEDVLQLNERYTLIGQSELVQSGACPIELKLATVVVDSVSERRILRIQAVNSSPVEVSAVVLSVVPRTNDLRPLGVIKNLKYVCAEPFCVCQYGVVLPSEATNGVIRIERVEFSDGLYWDKTPIITSFSTKEKEEYDTELFVSAYGE